jgi:hypothetical protein
MLQATVRRGIERAPPALAVAGVHVITMSRLLLLLSGSSLPVTFWPTQLL